MSMSQEEIESLMNDLDVEELETPDDEQQVHELDILIKEEVPEPPEEDINLNEETLDNQDENIAALESSLNIDEKEQKEEESEEIKKIEESSNTKENEKDEDDKASSKKQKVVTFKRKRKRKNIKEDTTKNVDEILSNAGSQETKEEPVQKVDTEDIDNLIASLDSEEPKEEPKKEEDISFESTMTNTKVVSELNSVANDSEEKATKILDVLSSVIDTNNKNEKRMKKLSEFLSEQERVLEVLRKKFPNVDMFAQNQEMLKMVIEEPKIVKNSIAEQNQELYSIMELMQYHDINKQKIQRVMSIIKKLSLHLNSIFEDDSDVDEEIVTAKHIAGDKSPDLVGADDLDALIEEFGN